MRTKVLAALALLLMITGAFAVVSAAGGSDAATAPDGGSGTVDDPYYFYMNMYESYTLQIPTPGSFTTLYAVSPSTFSIGGMTFQTSSGSVDSITSAGISTGQNPSITLTGTPNSNQVFNGTYMLMATNPTGTVYTLITVLQPAQTNYPTPFAYSFDEYSVKFRVFMGGQTVTSSTVTDITISPHPEDLGYAEADMPDIFGVTPIVGKSIVEVKVPRENEIFIVGFRVSLQQGSYLASVALFSAEDPRLYTITFFGNGGTIPSQYSNEVTTQMDGTLASLPPVARAPLVSETEFFRVETTTYNFNDWWSDPSSGYPISTSTVFFTSLQVFAHWTSSQTTQYTSETQLNLYSDGELYTTEIHRSAFVNSASSAPQYVEATIDATPVKPNHTLLGWASPQTPNDIIAPGATATFPRGPVTLNAVWEYVPPTFTVTFDTHGGSPVQQQSVQEGQTATRPSDPVRSGYDFDGWYTTADCTQLYDFTSPVTSDVTLHAGWSATIGSQANPYELTFLLNSYSIKTVASPSSFPTVFLQCTSSSSQQLQTEIPGLEFRGSDGRFTQIPAGGQAMGQSPIVRLAGIPTLEGTWLVRSESPLGNSVYTRIVVTNTPVEPTVFTVSFNADGGSGTIPSQQVQSGNSITLPSEGFAKSGFYLSGWKLSDGTTFALGETVRVTQDLSLTAVWSPIPSGSDAGAPSQVDVGSTYLYRPIVNQQLSTGSSSNWIPFIALMVESPASGYHLVSNCPDWMEVTYNSQNFTIRSKSALTVSDVGAHNITMQVWRNTIVHGDEMRGEVTWVVTVTDPSSSQRFTVSFDPNGGTGTQPSLEPVQVNNVVTLPGFAQLGYSRPGYTQVGWQGIDEYGRTAVYFLNSTYTVTRDITLDAYWVPNPNIVILEANGGVGSIDPYIAYTGSTITLPTHGITRPGYTLAGWQPYQGSSVYAKGFMMDVEGAVRLQAYWIPDGVTVSNVVFNNNGGTGYLTQDVLPGASVFLPKYGFTSADGQPLIGWSSIASGGTVLGPLSEQTIGESKVFYAVYQQSAPVPIPTHTVVFSAGEGVGSYLPQTVTDGGTVSRPGADPTRAGYLFLGWGVLGGPSSWDFSSPVTESMVLIAQWDLHFTLQTDGTEITLTFAPNYAGSNNTVDWGDGSPTQEVFSVSVTHDTETSNTGTVTVTTVTGSGQMSSQRPWSTFGGAGQVPLIASGSVTVHGDGSLTLDASGSSGFTAVSWFIDGEMVGQNLVVISAALETGTHEIILKVTNDVEWEQWTTTVEIGGGSSSSGDSMLLPFVILAAVIILVLAFVARPFLLAAVPALIIIGWWLFA